MYDQNAANMFAQQQPPVPGAVPPQPAQPAAPMPGQQQMLDPKMVEAMLALNQQPAQAAQIARQRKLADQMRADATGQLQGMQAGRLYRAPGLLNLAANVMGQREAGRMSDQADVAGMNAATQQQAALRGYFNALSGRKEPPLPYMGGEGE